MENKLIIEYKATPSQQNIYYAFERLITPLAVATVFEPYAKSRKEFEFVLDNILNWLINYDKNKDLSVINACDINKIDSILYNLDGEYLAVDGLYAEEAYIWLGQLKVLTEKSKIGGDK